MNERQTWDEWMDPSPGDEYRDVRNISRRTPRGEQKYIAEGINKMHQSKMNILFYTLWMYSMVLYTYGK